MVTSGCDDVRERPQASNAATSTASEVVSSGLSDHVRRRLQQASDQGLLHRAEPREAKVLISIEPQFAANADCLATAAVHILQRAGYSAWDQWNHEAGVDLHLLASAHVLEGQATLVLSNDEAYIASLLPSTQPTRSNVERLLSKLIASRTFRSLVESTEHAGANSVTFPGVKAEQAFARCSHWSGDRAQAKTGKSSITGGRNQDL